MSSGFPNSRNLNVGARVIGVTQHVKDAQGTIVGFEGSGRAGRWLVEWDNQALNRKVSTRAIQLWNASNVQQPTPQASPPADPRHVASIVAPLLLPRVDPNSVQVMNASEVQEPMPPASSSTGSMPVASS